MGGLFKCEAERAETMWARARSQWKEKAPENVLVWVMIVTSTRCEKVTSLSTSTEAREKEIDRRVRKIVVQAVIRRMDRGTRCTYFFFRIRCCTALQKKGVKDGQNVRRMLSPHQLRGHQYKLDQHDPLISLCIRLTNVEFFLVWTPVDDDSELEGQRVAREMAVGACPWDLLGGLNILRPTVRIRISLQTPIPIHTTTNATTRRTRICHRRLPNRK
jgi:hypothetical protein